MLVVGLVGQVPDGQAQALVLAKAQVAPRSAVTKPAVAFSVPRVKRVAMRSWRSTRRSVKSA